MAKNIAEFSIIDEFFKPLTNSVAAAQNLADDVAKISLKKGEDLVISKDMIVEDVHFLRKDGGFKIASKLLRSNLSDIAAAGAKPIYYMLGFSKDNKMDKSFFTEFARGLKESQDEFGISLIGGDTVKTSSKLFFSITILGIVKENQNLLRKNGKKDDIVFVSGNIGDAAIGLMLARGSKLDLIADEKKYFLARHFFPTPRIKLGQSLASQNLSHCAIDVSDGLLADLQHICEESNLSAFIYQSRIPLTITKKTLPKSISPLDLISAGDDYELIFTAKKSAEKKILRLAKTLKIKITAIGYLKNATKKPTVTILDNSDKPINFSKYGYQH
ncbi:MAG: thiamine-phosphate kinase [Rickettsiales bacterium]|nr:thiamine-phosphate kinase [Rickettsiales bacterium]